MIKKIYSAVVLLSLVAPVAAFAAEDTADVHGLVELGVRGVSSNSDSASFQEFRDMSDGIFGQVQLDTFKGDYHFQFDALNPGADDQSFQLKGGEYDNFKYKFNYNEMTHNYSFGAISPAAGIGTTALTFPQLGNPGLVANSPAEALWTPFDYKVEHKNYGGEVEFSFHSPFYLNVGAERREQEGLRPFSVKQPAEVPEPISNTTNNLFAKFGYVGDMFAGSLSGSLSSFNNDHKYLTWTDPDYSATISGYPTDILAFSPDNDYGKIGADLSWRDLPLASVLAVGGSYSHLENSFSAAEIGYPAAAGINTTIVSDTILNSLSRRTFDGDVDYTAASISLASHPLDKLDSKIYYRYLDRDNNSSIITYTATPPAGSNVNWLMSYQKDDAGIDLGYHLPYKTKLEGGYEYLKMDRSTSGGEGIPTDSTRDDSVYVGLKNSALDWLTAKLRYKHLERDSDIINGMFDESTPFYYQDQSSDEWKVGFDFYPVDSVDLGVSYAHKNIDYDYSGDTRQKDTRQNVYVDVAWRANTMATFSGFVGYETVKTDANRFANGASNSATLTTTPYSQTNDDDFWTYGLAANIAATEKLTFNLAWQYQKSDGQVDFSNPNFSANTESDDYTKQTLEAKATYAIDPRLKMTVGYLYEKYEYLDVNYENYDYTVAQSAATYSYYSGYNRDPNYEANVGYLMVAYGF